MSWNISLSLSNLYQAVKLLQTTALTNPLVANLQLNNYVIQGVPVIQGGTAGGLALKNSVGTITALSYPSNGIVTFGVGLISPYTQYSDASSQSTANDLYITGTVSNVNYPIAMLGANTTGRTSAYTDGAGYINYNPSTNQLNINNNGKLVLNGATSALTFGGTINTFSTTTFSNTMNVLTRNNTFSGSNIFSNGIITSTVTANTGNNIDYNVGSGYNHNFIVNGSLTTNINIYGITSNSYTGNSFGYASSGADMSYSAPTDYTHSFKVGGVTEYANISSNGLNSNNLNAISGSLTYSVGLNQKHNLNVNSVNIAYVDANGLTVPVGKSFIGNRFTYDSNSTNMSYVTPTSYRHSFLVGLFEYATINSSGLSVSNINSLTSNITYNVGTSNKHSFTVNSVECVSIDSNGLTFPSTVPDGRITATSGTIILKPNSTKGIYMDSGSNGFNVRSNNASTTWMTVNSSGSVFNGPIDLVGGAIASGKATLNITSSGDRLQGVNIKGGDPGMALYNTNIDPKCTWSFLTNNFALTGGLNIYSDLYNKHALSIDSSGFLYLASYSTSGTLTLNSANGAVTILVSDKRLKQNVNYIKNSLSIINQLKPCSYSFISDTQNQNKIGFIADDVMSVIPEAVDGKKHEYEWECLNDEKGFITKIPKLDEQGKFIYKKDENGNLIPRYKSLTDTPIIAHLVGAVKELNTIIDQQQILINSLITNVKSLTLDIKALCSKDNIIMV
jgi:hypothetical protein